MIVLNFTLYAQKYSTKIGTTQCSNAIVVSAINISVLIPQLTPKSHNIASVGHYEKYPVSMYTGIPTIEIPIFTIEVGGLSQPIKLSYHASRIKVTDATSLVGLNWSLQYNSSVNRQLRGLFDESRIGLLEK